jgi:hypothetical protein
MKKVIRLTESDVERLVKKVIKESKETYTTEENPIEWLRQNFEGMKSKKIKSVKGDTIVCNSDDCYVLVDNTKKYIYVADFEMFYPFAKKFKSLGGERRKQIFIEWLNTDIGLNLDDSYKVMDNNTEYANTVTGKLGRGQLLKNLNKKTVGGGFIYLSMYYSTGEEDYGDEDYDSSQYVEGLVLSKIPVKTFTNIMGTTEVEEIVMYEGDGSYDLIEEMLHNYDLSVDKSTGQQISPDIQDGWTQGTIDVIDEREYSRLLGRYNKK